MPTKDPKQTTAEMEKRADSPRSVSRRALLKSTATAMPAILTLQSGAALARSSNMITAAAADVRDQSGRALCLDVDSVYPMHGATGVYDMGEPAFAKINAIPERDYTIEPDRRGTAVDESDMCLRGVPGYYQSRKGGGWKKVETRGMMISATAVRSFAGHIQITEL